MQQYIPQPLYEPQFAQPYQQQQQQQQHQQWSHNSLRAGIPSPQKLKPAGKVDTST
jgi:hypothetical protein